MGLPGTSKEEIPEFSWIEHREALDVYMAQEPSASEDSVT
jgi:hypothetical protein